MVTKTESIKAFLNAFAPSDLANLYNHDMEIQVTVAKDAGERITGDFKGKQWHAYTDGIQTWKPIRIPVNGNTNPEFTDSPMVYDLKDHAEGIGQTGWNWKNKVSCWVAFDFDAITGHSDKHAKKLTDTQLEEIKAAVYNIPWISIRKSTGGKGLHLYAFLESVTTNIRNEHAAVAKAILSQLSALVGYDFQTKVDTCITKDTWTLTKEGPRQVKELIGKPQVLVVDGKEYSTEGFFQTGHKEVFEVITEEGYKFKATSDHKILTNYKFGYKFSKLGTVQEFNLDQEVSKLNIGDKVFLNNHQDIEWDGEGNYNEGYILGWLFGDEYFSNDRKDKHGLYFYDKDLDLINYVSSLFTKEIRITGLNNPYGYLIQSLELEDLKTKFNLNSEKIINEFIESASSDFLEGFLSAFFDTDGCVARDEIRLSQSNFQILQSIQRVLLRFGIKSKIYKRSFNSKEIIKEKEYNIKEKFDLIISKSNLIIFKERINFKHNDKRQKLDLLIDSRNLLKEDFLVTIKSIKSVGFEDVYCCTVPQIHHFDANGLFIRNCGGNMWVWHRKLASTNGEGLRLIKAHTSLAKVPENWKDYLNVVSGKRNKNLPRYIEEQKSRKSDIEDLFAELTGQRLRVTLDEEHKKVFNWIVENYPNAVWWDSDHHMMVTHTAILKECHDTLCLRGAFETLAKGEEKGVDINCYAFPLLKGGWSIRRYTLGVQEHASWEQDGSGWTKTFFNKEPDLHTACKLNEGIEAPKGGYWFANAEQAQKAALLIGANLNLPNHVLMKKARLLPHKSGRLAVEIDKDNDTPPLAGWLSEKNKFVKMFNINSSTPGEPEVINFDQDIRHLVTENGDDFGWVVKSENEWHQEPFQHIKEVIRSRGFNPKDVSNILGTSITQCWTLVNMPFREEYPSDRKWNRHAVQLRFKPKADKENLNYPTWSKILNHCGTNLTDAVQINGWCKANNIITGADYLKCWIASLFQFPTEPLPYLFFYGPQNNGKSIFHEALALLLTGGVCRADTALTNGSGFNGELEGAILCIVEETDLRKNLVAYNRIKDWVTSLKLPIHKKQRQPYLTPNLGHYIQCSNDYNSCPVLMGDSRITMVYVPELKPEELIPKKLLIPLLEQEAADFITEILGIELPPSNDRLNVPVLPTEDKRIAELANQSLLGIFVEEKCFYAPGYKIQFSEFYDRFIEWLDPNITHQWSKHRVGKEILNIPKYPKGRLAEANGQFFIGNMSWVEIKEDQYKPKYISLGNYLRLEKDAAKYTATVETNSN